MNRAMLVGRLTTKPELRYTSSNLPFARFSVAVNRTYKNAEGNYDTDFIDMIVWNELAERVSTYCHKGDLISAEGRIETRMVTVEDHNEKVTSLVCEKVSFLSTKKDDKESE